jgi:hypothetical protein
MNRIESIAFKHVCCQVDDIKGTFAPGAKNVSKEVYRFEVKLDPIY